MVFMGLALRALVARALVLLLVEAVEALEDKPALLVPIFLAPQWLPTLCMAVAVRDLVLPQDQEACIFFQRLMAA